MELIDYLNNEIHIISGEGAIGTRELSTGKRTERAIKMRLTRERSHGDRWARCLIYSHKNDWGKHGVDFETGEYTTWHDLED